MSAIDKSVENKSFIAASILRMIGGFTGGSLPNSMSLTRFRSIAGCCAGFAPIGLWRAWLVSVEETDKRVTVNIPLNKEVKKASVRSFYPNKGCMERSRRSRHFSTRRTSKIISKRSKCSL